MADERFSSRYIRPEHWMLWTHLLLNPGIKSSQSIGIHSSLENRGHRLLDGLLVAENCGEEGTEKLLLPRRGELDIQGNADHLSFCPSSGGAQGSSGLSRPWTQHITHDPHRVEQVGLPHAVRADNDCKVRVDIFP